MRLFLASASVGGPVPELTDLVGAGARVAVSANALDEAAAGERAAWLEHELAALRSAGLRPAELDLRERAARRSWQSELAGVDAIWATGGNAFALRHALQASGVEELLRARLAEDSLAYGGTSAGACVCGPTLHGLELVDDPYACGEPIFDGLGLVDFAIVPHAGGEAGGVAEVLIAHHRAHGIPYCALRDGEAIVVHGETMRTLRG